MNVLEDQSTTSLEDECDAPAEVTARALARSIPGARAKSGDAVTEGHVSKTASAELGGTPRERRIGVWSARAIFVIESPMEQTLLPASFRWGTFAIRCATRTSRSLRS